jgi:hypothetical protein|tara:strand:+ start:3524 stop:4261 length:738 start_codon:yes stop_codon:yes gene_type:complete
MISVIEIFNVVRDIANKEQKGFVTPEVFNTFADIAQKNIFNEMFREMILSQQVRRQSVDPGRYKSIKKNVQEDLSRYIQEAFLAGGQGQVLANEDVVVFDKPDDFARMISARTEEGVTIELMYDTEKVSRMLNSRLSSPTDEFPVMAVGNDLRVYPANVQDVVLRYYRQPTSVLNNQVDPNALPTYSVTFGVEPGTYIVNPFDIRDFDLPNHYKNELVTEILKLIGVRLRDADIFNYTNAEDAAE